MRTCTQMHSIRCMIGSIRTANRRKKRNGCLAKNTASCDILAGWLAGFRWHYNANMWCDEMWLLCKCVSLCMWDCLSLRICHYLALARSFKRIFAWMCAQYLYRIEESNILRSCDFICAKYLIQKFSYFCLSPSHLNAWIMATNFEHIGKKKWKQPYCTTYTTFHFCQGTHKRGTRVSDMARCG